MQKNPRGVIISLLADMFSGAILTRKILLLNGAVPTSSSASLVPGHRADWPAHQVPVNDSLWLSL